MSKKFIPTGDSEFANMARCFVLAIAKDPAKYQVSCEEFALLETLVSEYRTALAATMSKATRTQMCTLRKNAARKTAKARIEAIGARIRANEALSSVEKLAVRVFERAKKLKRTKCPQWGPQLHYKGAKNEGGLTGRQHVIEFFDPGRQTFPLQRMMPLRGKPEGAARIELYVGYVFEGEPIPQRPDDLPCGYARHLGSFTRSPMTVDFPLPQRAMRVLYWARWAGTAGDMGAWSKTCVAPTEGWAQTGAALPDLTEVRRREQRIVITSARRELPDYGKRIEAAGAGVARLLPGAA